MLFEYDAHNKHYIFTKERVTIMTMRGTCVGNYQIIRKLGEGGMGAVYLGQHQLLGRTAAIKTLLPELCQKPELVQRFFNEARAVTAVKHPGIIELYDFGFQTDGTAYITMEFLDGEPLQDRLRRCGAVPENVAVDITWQLAHALSAAHGQGIIHRDLKPDNIFLVPDPEIGERVKILDFGIAKLASDEQAGKRTTRTGMILGTPLYMSPEQCCGAGNVTHSADLYALGCILFELVCGRTPFVHEGSGAIMGAHIYESPPSPRSLQPDLSPALEAVILRLLGKKPEDRFASTEELLHALADCVGQGAMAGSGRTPLRQTTRPGTVRQTTLSSAASAVASTSHGTASEAAQPTRSARGRWLFRSATAALCLGAAIAIFQMRSQTDEEPRGERPAQLTSAAPARAHVAEHQDVDAPTPIAVETVEAAGSDGQVELDDAAPESPTAIIIRIESQPDGAEVFSNESGEVLGETPFQREYAVTATTREFVVRKRGYREQIVSLAGDRSERVQLDLHRKKKRKKTPPDTPAKDKDSRRTGDEDNLERGGYVDPF